MRKASKVLCLIGGILGIILSIVWLIVAIVYFANGAVATAIASGKVGGEIPQAIRDFLTEFMKEHPGYTWEQIAESLMGTAVLFTIMFLFSVPCVVFSFIVKGKEKTGLALPIVLVVLSWAGNVCSFVGGVLAIVNWAVVENKQK